VTDFDKELASLDWTVRADVNRAYEKALRLIEETFNSLIETAKKDNDAVEVNRLSIMRQVEIDNAQALWDEYRKGGM
jgi:hypothetical protein